MAGHTILLNLIGGVALLLWGTHMVQAAILQGLRRPSSAARSPAPPAAPLRAAATGAAAATALQSATATAMLVTGFVARGLIALPAALALMLGADLGTTLAVQALSRRPRRADAAPARRRRRAGAAGRAAARRRRSGRMLVGLGLILLALRLIAAASAPMRDERGHRAGARPARRTTRSSRWSSPRSSPG